MRRWFAAGVVGAACLLTRQPLAQAEVPAEHAGALFGEGRDAMKRRDYSAACAKFEESQRLDPSLGTLLNLGVCEEQRGHLLRAAALLAQFLDSAEPHDDRRASAERLAESIDLRLSRLLVQVEPRGLADVRLSVDGHVQKFAATTQIKLDPGKHELELSAAGYSTERATVELAEAELGSKSLVLKALPTASASPPSVERHWQTAPPEATQASPLFYVALGTGLLGALTIAGSGVMIANERSTVHDHCSGKNCDAEGLAAGERGKTLVIINTVAWPIALAGASLAAYVVLSKDRHQKAQYAVRVAGSPGQSSLLLEGGF